MLEKAPAPAGSGSPWPTGHQFTERARAERAAVHALLAVGHSRRAIQRRLGMTYRAVQRLADAARPEDLFQGQWQNRRTKLDDFKLYLHERWVEGHTNAWNVWGEIKTQTHSDTLPESEGLELNASSLAVPNWMPSPDTSERSGGCSASSRVTSSRNG
ncbi:hypothetical protein GCM10010300_74060 [Streptomyces olivaceoviridis]|uniref:hypothetical protein n=1 Tax=Streptomyces olivaceoviridis TaxID=1921 RepID=UPI0016776EEF|nr:hypothetical protein [Streptomyces olivaceoviridis]GGZ19296.1 hypothetical protein GCM10010300_74060 [Streptomyces olivaceoviridis]